MPPRAGTVLFVTLCSLLGIPVPGSAQVQMSDADQAGIISQSISGVSEFLKVPLSSFLIRTKGLLAESTPRTSIRNERDRPRPARQEVVSRLRGDSLQLVDIDLDEWSIGRVPGSIAVPGDSVAKVVRVVPVVYADSIRSYVLTKTIVRSERIERADLLSFLFRKKDGDWRIVESRWETGDVVAWQ